MRCSMRKPIAKTSKDNMIDEVMGLMSNDKLRGQTLQRFRGHVDRGNWDPDVLAIHDKHVPEYRTQKERVPLKR
eukprot:9239987-Pyramimonas_sp.AAC.1